MKKLIIARKSSQVFFLFLFVYILWRTVYTLKGLLPPETFFIINPYIITLVSVSEKVILPGTIFAVAMIIITLVFGRFYCGWICPLGTIIDWIGVSRRAKQRLTDAGNARIRKIKFYFLAVFFVFSLLGIQLAWVLDPIAITVRFVSLNFIPAITLGIEKIFIFLIKDLNLCGNVYGFYHTLKSSGLSSEAYYFYNSGIIFVTFLLVILSALIISRFWCRILCPLGACYALIAGKSLLRRTVSQCVDCDICRSSCRMGAIQSDISYVKGECILCMDCIYDYPQHITKFTPPLLEGAGFTWPRTKNEKPSVRKKGSSLSRRQFLFLVLGSAFLTGFKGDKKGERKRNVIRPPAALGEQDFVDRCIRCAICMKVCPTNGLQPVMFETGFEGIWTPQLVPEIGHCEYYCTSCGKVCPTGAIAKLTQEAKLKTVLGKASVDRSICLPWAEKKECTICEKHCPVPNKAIKITGEMFRDKLLKKPFVDSDLCVGCGLCQRKCPVRPTRAIRVKGA